MGTKPSCQNCDKPKIPGRGQRYCEDCRPKLEWLKRLTRQPCKKCGGSKGSGVGRIYCDDCKEAQQWLYERKRAYKPVRWCSKCKKSKVQGHNRHCEKCRDKTTMCSRCGLNPTRGFRTKLCEACYQESRVAGNAYRSKWRQERRKDPAWAENERQRARRYAQKRTKQQRAQHAESRRINWRLKHDTKPVALETYLKGYGKVSNDPQVPAGPLLLVIEAWLMENAFLVNGVIYSPEHKLLKAANVSEKLIRQMRNGSRTRIRIRDADNLCYEMGTTLNFVYKGTLADGNRQSLKISA